MVDFFGNLLKKLIIGLSSILLFVFAIEVSARVDDKIKYQAPFWGKYTSERLRTTDEDGIPCNVPHSRFEKWKINQFGFRGPDLALKKPDAMKRVICMGTSETFGLYESPGKEWPAQLRESLSRYGNFQVINASIVGLPLDQYLPYIEKNVLALEPDILLLYVNPFGYGADVDKFNTRQNGQAPEEESKEEESQKDETLFSVKGLKANLRMFPKIKQAVKQILPDNIIRWRRRAKLERQIAQIETVSLHHQPPADTVAQKNLQLFGRDLKRIVRHLQSIGIKVVLTSYPALISEENLDTHMEIFLDHRRFYIELSLQGLLDASIRFNEVIKMVASDCAADFVDMNALVPKEVQYFADNVHYTDEGATIVAKNFGRYLEGH